MKSPKPITFEVQGEDCVVTSVATNLSGVELARWSIRVPAAAIDVERRGLAAHHLRGGLGQVALQMAQFLAEEARKTS